jgi:hypothetical protein
MSYICKDCGADTTPCTGKRGRRHKGRWEHYMVTGDVWKAAGIPAPTVKGYNETDGGLSLYRVYREAIGTDADSGRFYERANQ